MRLSKRFLVAAFLMAAAGDCADPGEPIAEPEAVEAAVPSAGQAEKSPSAVTRAWGHRDPDSPRFTLAILPDTQYLFDEDRSDPEPVRAALRYLQTSDARGREERNILFMAQLGDVTEHGTAEEVELADRTFREIDGRVPYSILAGNHDVPGRTDDQRGPTPFLAAFGPDRFRDDPTFGGASPGGYNRFHVFRGGGRDWLILALDWRLSDAGFAWAQSVIDAHPQTPVILTTHELAVPAGEGGAALSGYGQTLWDRLIRRNDSIFLTVNGHFWPLGRTVLKNDAGNDVHVNIANYQDRYYGGSGMIRLYTFDLARETIDVETISPWILAKRSGQRTTLEHIEVMLTDEINRFSLPIDFDQRFAGFAPVPPRTPRPGTDLIIPGTVAYWRFDDGAAHGQPVPDGATVADLAGRGNDLSVVRLTGSPPSALRWTTDHHPDQPAHASLFFDGGMSPPRGAYLRTADGAPLNSMQFETGFTIEAFIKIPPEYDSGGHNWMGMFSWMGRSGDAGKTGGDPEEPVSSLNLAPERFLQFIAYPVNRNDPSTHWSHAVPAGTWVHVAVVNDGRRTTVYVDGSPISRNPSRRAKGISTTGTPFAVGGTQYANAFYQTFFGWIGDMRIVSRPLRPHDFMTAASAERLKR